MGWKVIIISIVYILSRTCFVFYLPVLYFVTSGSPVERPPDAVALDRLVWREKDGCLGGNGELPPCPVSQLRRHLLLSGALRSAAGPARAHLPAAGAIPAGHILR